MREYAEYQSPGLDFVEQIPAHWKMVPFRHVFTESREVNGKTPVGPMLSVSGYRGVEVKEYDSENRRRTPEEVASYRVVRPGQLAVNTMWLNYAGLGVSDFEGHMSPAYRAYNISPSLEPRYVHHLLRSSTYVQGYTALLTGIRPNSLQMSRDDLMNFPVILPPLEEQRLIADYLDRETAEIDAALAEHKHLRALLLERRAETITAATRPSNPELKEAPLVRLRHVASLNPSPRVNISPDSAQLFPLFSMDSISEFGPLRPPVLRPYSELATGYSYLEPTDVAYAKVTPCFENGKGLVGAELDGPSFATTELTVLRPAPEVDQNYLALVLQSADFHAVGEASMTGAGGLKRVSEHAARNYRFLLPDKKTQIRIVEQVRLEADETDVLISDSNRLSDLLLERRAALISAAVTGQIDVASHGVSAAERLQDELEVHV